MLTATFKGRFRSWYEFLPTKSIHSWKQFTQLFLSAHENFNYKKLGFELENIHRYKDESLDDLFFRFLIICCRFHERHQLSEKDIIYWFCHLNFLSDTLDLEKNDKYEINDMHIDNFDSSVKIDLESNPINSPQDNEIVVHGQELGFCDTHFHE